MVDYEERLYAAGKIKGSRFIKREGRPTDEAVLKGRTIDRSLRPLFNDVERRDVQVTTTVLCVDQKMIPMCQHYLALQLLSQFRQSNGVVQWQPFEWGELMASGCLTLLMKRARNLI